MADKDLKSRCSGCASRDRELATLQERVDQLEAELARAKKNSSNSSQPPSTDITRPKPKSKQRGRPKKRRLGGQPGHPRHERTPFSPDQIETRWIHYYTGSPCCGAAMTDTDEPVKVLQQVEIIDCPLRIEEHVRRRQCCSACGKKHLAPWPEDLKKAGLVGSRLTTWVGYLKSACHMSFLSIRKDLRDVVGLTLSRGHLRNLVSKVSDSLLEPYEQLIALLPKEEMLNVDETGHRENGARLWTWCFRASLYTVFKISPSRGSDVLIDVLGQEFRGVLGCDYFSADRKYMRLNENVVLQFCLAHFIRDVKFLTKHPNAKNRRHGERLLGHFRKLFQTLHRRDGFASEATFRASLERIRDDLIHDAIMLSPGTREADNLGDRFVNHFESFFTFITTPGIPPTNNLAEQAIRFVAIHRRLTQGTRSPAGRITCQRLWTVIETCEQQARSTFNYLADAVSAYFRGQPAPSLVPDTS